MSDLNDDGDAIETPCRVVAVHATSMPYVSHSAWLTSLKLTFGNYQEFDTQKALELARQFREERYNLQIKD